MPVNAHAEMRIGALQLPMLRLGDRDIGRVFAQRLARQRARGHVPQMIGGPEQHVGERIGLVAKPPNASGLVPPPALRAWSENVSDFPVVFSVDMFAPVDAPARRFIVR
jgi:hypothetical protein